MHFTRLTEKQTSTQRYRTDPDDVAYYTERVIRQLHRDIEDFIQRWYEQAYRTFSDKIGFAALSGTRNACLKLPDTPYRNKRNPPTSWRLNACWKMPGMWWTGYPTMGGKIEGKIPVD
jgi:hypothetical protein